MSSASPVHKKYLVPVARSESRLQLDSRSSLGNKKYLVPVARSESRLQLDSRSSLGNKTKSAAGWMTRSVPMVRSDQSVDDVRDFLIKHGGTFETINYIYVVRADGMLEGVLSIRELLNASPEVLMQAIMHRDVVSVHEHAHQEQLAIRAIQHNIKAIPVVDSSKKLLGVVPSDAILLILHEEHIEDALRSAGIRPFDGLAEEFLSASVRIHVQKRLPWLMLGLFGGMCVALFIGFFEGLLKTELALAAFIPLIVYLADAVGGQTQAIFIRALSFGVSSHISRYIIKELFIGALIAVLFGGLSGFTVFWWLKSTALAGIIGTSVMITIVIAMLVALILPWFFMKRGIDPAIASGPLATVLRDIMSIAIYFGVATAVLSVAF